MDLGSSRTSDNNLFNIGTKRIYVDTEKIMKDKEIQKALEQADDELTEFRNSYIFDIRAVASLASGILIAQALEKINNDPPSHADGL